ncbi:hypothetical protein D3C71_2149490 [compost metagenome]
MINPRENIERRLELAKAWSADGLVFTASRALANNCGMAGAPNAVKTVMYSSNA